MSLDLDKAIATLKSCQIIAEEDVRALCNKAKEILMEEQNVPHVPIPATVVGDIHVQFSNLGAARRAHTCMYAYNLVLILTRHTLARAGLANRLF